MMIEEDFENCVECNDPHFDLCHYCADSLCDVHARAIPGFHVLKACATCFEKYEEPALRAITAFVAEAA